MLTAYLDESTDSKKQRAYGVAGYFADAGKWAAFSLDWDHALCDIGLSAFHAVDCEHGRKEFEGMSKPEREEVVCRFIRIIRKHDPMGVITWIDLRAYNVLQPRIKELRTLRPGLPVQGSLEDPYFLGFQHAVEHVATSPFVESLPPGERVGFVFDRHHLSGRVSGLYRSMINGVSYRDRLGKLTFNDKKVCKPLQAADLLAYEGHRHFHDTVLNGEPERWQFKELRPTIGEARFFAMEQLAELSSLMEQQFGNHPGDG